MSSVDPAQPRFLISRRRALSLAACLLAGVIVALSSAVSFGVLEPDPACGPCHARETAALTRSGHASVACYECHAGRGAGPRTARYTRDAFKSYRLPGPVVEAVVEDSACLGCHEGIQTIVEAGGIRMSHGTCVDEDAACTDCHSDTGHGTGGAGRTLSMDSCSRCHDGDTAQGACETCHAGDTERTDRVNAWAVVHGKNWRSTHGMGELSTCATCHDREDCSRCHSGMPHPSSWPRTHGLDAMAEGVDSCLRCHVKGLCEGCHGIDMPHPAGWLPDHTRSVVQLEIEKRCLTCHSDEDCTGCHEMHTHPGLPPERLEELRSP